MHRKQRFLPFPEKIVFQDLNPCCRRTVIVFGVSLSVYFLWQHDPDHRQGLVYGKGIGRRSVPADPRDPVAQGVGSADLQGIVPVLIVEDCLCPPVLIAALPAVVRGPVSVRRRKVMRDLRVCIDPDPAVLNIAVDHNDLHIAVRLKILFVPGLYSVVVIDLYPRRRSINSKLQKTSVQGRRRTVPAVIPGPDCDGDIIGFRKRSRGDPDSGIFDVINQSLPVGVGSVGLLSGIGKSFHLHPVCQDPVSDPDLHLHLFKAGASPAAARVADRHLQVQ